MVVTSLFEKLWKIHTVARQYTLARGALATAATSAGDDTRLFERVGQGLQDKGFVDRIVRREGIGDAIFIGVGRAILAGAAGEEEGQDKHQEGG